MIIPIIKNDTNGYVVSMMSRSTGFFENSHFDDCVVAVKPTQARNPVRNPPKNVSIAIILINNARTNAVIIDPSMSIAYF